MKCIVAGPNVKILGKAIHTLAKIGDELYLESLESGLAVRTVNASRSAFAGFTFPPSFFLEYDERGTINNNTIHSNNDDDDDNSSFKGKLAVRSVLFVFKRLADMDKSVERCLLTADSASSRVVFTFHCKYGIVKTHKLAFIESETLVVNHDKSSVPNRITSAPSVFLDAAACFHANVDEIVFEPLFDRLVVRNHCDEADLMGGPAAGGGSGVGTDPAKMSSVKYSLSPEEFDVYVVKDAPSADDKSRGMTTLEATATDAESADAESAVAAEKRLIRFCLKELRALLSFAETYATSIGVYFGQAGEPIVFTLDSDPGYEADFVFATSPPEDGVGSAGSGEETRAAAAPPPPRSAASASKKSTRGSPVKRAILTQHSQHHQQHHAERRQKTTPHDVSRHDESALNATTTSSASKANNAYNAHDISATSSTGNGRQDSRGEGMTTTFVNSAEAEAKRKATFRKLLGDDDDSDEEEPAMAPKTTETKTNGTATKTKTSATKTSTTTNMTASNSRRVKPSLLPESDEEEEEEEDVPTTPPSKKFKSIFGFSESQTQSSVKTLKSQQSAAGASANTQREILAEDSEED